MSRQTWAVGRPLLLGLSGGSCPTTAGFARSSPVALRGLAEWGASLHASHRDWGKRLFLQILFHVEELPVASGHGAEVTAKTLGC